MTFPRRRFLHLAAGAAALPVMGRTASAQAYPTRPVHLVVPSTAGGGIDILARFLGQWLSDRLGRQFVIDNRPGAGGNIGVEMVVRAPPDGYTLLLVAVTNAINATLYDKLSFNFIRDIAPVAGATPRYGTCSMLMPVIILNSSPAMCCGVPLPLDAMLSLPGLALA